MWFFGHCSVPSRLVRAKSMDIGTSTSPAVIPWFSNQGYAPCLDILQSWLPQLSTWIGKYVCLRGLPVSYNQVCCLVPSPMSHGSFYVTYLGHILLTYGSRHQHTLLLSGVLQLLCNLGYSVSGDHDMKTWLMDTWYQMRNECIVLHFESTLYYVWLGDELYHNRISRNHLQWLRRWDRGREASGWGPLCQKWGRAILESDTTGEHWHIWQDTGHSPGAMTFMEGCQR